MAGRLSVQPSPGRCASVWLFKLSVHTPLSSASPAWSLSSGACCHHLGLSASVSLPELRSWSSWLSLSLASHCLPGIPGPFRIISQDLTLIMSVSSLFYLRFIYVSLCPSLLSNSHFSDYSFSLHLTPHDSSLLPSVPTLLPTLPTPLNPFLLPPHPVPSPHELEPTYSSCPHRPEVPQGRGQGAGGAFNPSLSAAGGSQGVSWASAWGGEVCECEQQGPGSEGVCTPGGLYRGPGRAGGGQAAGEGGLTHPDSPSLLPFPFRLAGCLAGLTPPCSEEGTEGKVGKVEK